MMNDNDNEADKMTLIKMTLNYGDLGIPAMPTKASPGAYLGGGMVPVMHK